MEQVQLFGNQLDGRVVAVFDVLELNKLATQSAASLIKDHDSYRVSRGKTGSEIGSAYHVSRWDGFSHPFGMTSGTQAQVRLIYLIVKLKLESSAHELLLKDRWECGIVVEALRRYQDWKNEIHLQQHPEHDESCQNSLFLENWTDLTQELLAINRQPVS